LLTKARVVHVGDPVLAVIRPTHFVLHRVVAIGREAVTLRATATSAWSNAGLPT
jgi:hypothetical protein